MASIRILNLIEQLANDARGNFAPIPFVADSVAQMLYRLQHELVEEARDEQRKFLEGKLSQYLLIEAITGQKHDYSVPVTPNYIDKEISPEYARLRQLLWSINVHVARQAVAGNPDANFKAEWEVTNPEGPVVWKLVNVVSNEVYRMSKTIGLDQKLYSMLDTGLGGGNGGNDTIAAKATNDWLELELVKEDIEIIDLPRITDTTVLHKLLAAEASQYARDSVSHPHPEAYVSMPYDQDRLRRLRVEFNLPAELNHALVRIRIREMFHAWIDPTEEKVWKLDAPILDDGIDGIDKEHLITMVWQAINERLDQLLKDLRVELGNCLPKEKGNPDEDAGTTDLSE